MNVQRPEKFQLHPSPPDRHTFAVACTYVPTCISTHKAIRTNNKCINKLSEDNLWKLVLIFHGVGSGIEVGPSGLVESVVTTNPSFWLCHWNSDGGRLC